MRRSRVLPLFALCAAALLGVMAWLTLTVQRLEESERRGREEAALEEAIRLALWRMESLLAPLMVQENAHPHYLYRASYPARLAATLSSDRPELANVPLVSPLAAPSSPYVRLHFQWDEKGRLSSPRLSAPRESQAGERANETTELLKVAARLADRATLLSRLSSEWLHVEHPSLVIGAREPTKLPTAAPTPMPAAQGEQAKGPPRESLETQQKALSTKEWQARSSSNVAVAEAFRAAAVARPNLPLTAGTSEVRVGRLEPMWLQGELVLARRVRIGSGELAQVCWLDWPATRSWLLEAIRDLLPQARLEAVAGNEQDETRRLAALPVKLVPGPLATPPELPPSRLGLPLAAAWALAGTSLLAIGALLAGMATLGERRAAFVSAVTHELRTPLTTFRLYADMLAEGMVQDEEQERQYLTTLRREAERQSHLVENVLAYSRLERGRYRGAREGVTVEELLASLAPGLADHAERAGMTLSTPAAGACLSASVRVDRSAVERILFNLVDNACKYARESSDRRIHLDCESDADSVRLIVSDHGPGLGRAEAGRLFRPFHKSAREAAQSAPGVGLGLALSRRLARAIGGDLRLLRTDAGGAAFGLRLPR